MRHYNILKTTTTLQPEQPEKIEASFLLSEASRILSLRAAERDCENTGERSMMEIVRTFNSLTGHNLTEPDGWSFMLLLKMVRARKGVAREDDYVDMVSYSALLGESRLNETKS